MSDSRRRSLLIGVVATLALLAPPGISPAASAPDKIHQDVRKDLAADDKAAFWVRMKATADLSAVKSTATKTEKTQQVYRAKSQTAETSQAALRELLKRAGADFTPYWIANVVRVTGGAKLADSIVKLPEVERIEPVRDIPMPKPRPAEKTAKVNAVEWNLGNINAPQVWAEAKNRGENIVVANIDTGVEFDHPAVAAQYRGRKGDGRVDHNYNWFNPFRDCTSGKPCDDTGHGTHTMGTMVGDDGTGNTIGVAPGAKWIAARACYNDWCYSEQLLAAGQWMLAPTDRSGANPRPDLAPDIVNNSWGGTRIDPFYKQVTEAWTAAGIFSVFSGGNIDVIGCNSAFSPGADLSSYSAGASNVRNGIASFSARGTGEAGDIKPNITAPGVSVRSSVTGGGYASYSGTSMSAPHVSATVALMWSASPALRGDVAATRALLDRTAIDVDDTSCGGTAADNNVWGEGRLDAYAAVRAVPYQQLGTVTGKVTSGSEPVAGVEVQILGPLNRTVSTTREGTFTLPRLPVGNYRLTTNKFGYGIANAAFTVTADQTTTKDVTLTALPTSVVTGTVTSQGAPAEGATVTAVGTPVSAVTDSAGRYRLTLPRGAHEVRFAAWHRCVDTVTASIEVNRDLIRDTDLPQRVDRFGYTCTVGNEPHVEGVDRVWIFMDDEREQVELPFPFPYYGNTYTRATVGGRGGLNFKGFLPSGLWGLPSWAGSDLIAPYFGNGGVDPHYSSVYTAALGTAPNRTFVIEWREFQRGNRPFGRVSFSVLLHENGTIGFRYRGIRTEADSGVSAIIGISDSDGVQAFEYSNNQSSLRGDQSLTFTPSRHGVATGVITDANDGKPVVGATVKIDGTPTFTTGADGGFRGLVPIGNHRVEVSKEHYGTIIRDITVTQGTLSRVDNALPTGDLVPSADTVTLVMPAGTEHTSRFRLTNRGTGATDYTIATDPTQPWLTVTPGTSTLPPGATGTVTVTASSSGMQPGTVRTGKLTVSSASGRKPEFDVNVRVVAPTTHAAVDTGGTREFVDRLGERWSADKAYVAGGEGYLGSGTRVHTSTAPIAGTAEQELFKQARERMLEYRFDNVPNGVYTVELGFADTRASRPGQRVFDVTVEGQPAVSALDLATSAGPRTAVTRQHTVTVVDGQLNVQFGKRVGDTIVNTVRVWKWPTGVTP
ncbi:S8 family serine peptidase [Sinosporangium siamense]|uniref:alpha-amylase n=1 Tax=Sinosporangium siamense TaxID=1367973 RepID=A0A919RHE8_9ACTN|nr:S8 family serine peptidase [Sinosporangium siamense]GII91899.1 hypothetical protein Ssi02_21300 [Sinosporangium siamense]